MFDALERRPARLSVIAPLHIRFMPLFTVIAEFGGGTYAGQVRARSIGLALQKWASAISIGTVTGLTPIAHRQLVTAIEGQPPVPLAKLKSTWCFSMVLRGKLMLIHAVLTAE